MSEHVGFRCPDDLIAVIQHQRDATGKGRTEVIVDMLRSSFPSILISDRAKLPNESVIYFVWNGQRLLYIGKTVNLRQRINSHHRLLQFVGAGEDVKVSWLPASEENLLAFESSLIEALDPELNGEEVPLELKTGNPFFSCRIPPDVLGEIEAYLERTGKGKADFLIAAYRLVIEQDALSTNNDADVDGKISQALAPVLKRIEELEGKLAA
ncbi:GIY-YIG nuclease family protein [Scytonema sp. UIC 10036]|uniref:GIY-YIG nuclease family protein n=1 Tax=Scytonema sp. UIC 10036 TaxID=2304196 RepID=UPI00140F60B6|nr:GIY-YIG nuclease family protein [Scytonema sp. UIC 10036]